MYTLSRLKNKNVLITGAASGIGRAAAFRIAQEEGRLALLDINIERLKDVAEEIRQQGGKVSYRTCDVSDFDQTQKMIEELSQDVGGIHALSHNAGILECYNTHEMTLEQWNKLILVNLTGTFIVNRHVLPHLLKNKCSYLVNTSSTAAEQPHPWMAAYAATKGAIKSFTRSLFVEYSLQGLHANCILPGGFITDLAGNFKIPEGANPVLLKTLCPLGKPNEVSTEYIAGVIALLVSDDAFHINGIEIPVDGGKIGLA